MWTCKKCGEKIEGQFDSCWRCSAPKPAPGEETAPESVSTTEKTPSWKLAYKMFRGTLATWDDLFTQAAYFATELGPERVLNISHSVDDSDGVVTVWYWSTGENPSASQVGP
jgi:hypothetical protein